MPAGWEDDGSSASPLTLAGKTHLPGLVTDLTFALFAQPVFGPLGAFWCAVKRRVPCGMKGAHPYESLSSREARSPA